MLCAIAVAAFVAEPILLDKVPITAELLVGRWEILSSTAKVSIKPAKVYTYIFRKSGIYSYETIDRKSGKILASGGGTYTIGDRRIAVVVTTPGNEGEVDLALKLLPAGRMLMKVIDGNTTVVVVKIDAP